MLDAPPKEIAAKPGYAQYTVTVIDDDGQAVDGLKQSDFLVSANGPTLPVEYFRDDKDAMPASIAIIVDTSGSMRSKVASTGNSKLQTVTDALRAASANLSACDEIALLVFAPTGDLISNTKVIVAEPLSTNHQASMNRLDSMTPYGRTPLYDSNREQRTRVCPHLQRIAIHELTITSRGEGARGFAGRDGSEFATARR
ncbi:MAG TPA: VWA domain-containing protein [Candidatus Binataceae bacterium]|nr:VWA domain-containing protein [Candidatus Binataceae bacterium]